MIQILALTLLLILIPSQANAYIDPGTGNALIYIFVSAFGVVGYFIKSVFYRLLGRQSSFQNESEHGIVIFSEGKRYSQTFLPIVKKLLERNCRFAYFTCDIEDPVLTIENNSIYSKYIGEGSAAFARMAGKKGHLLLSTTPNIGTLNFPMPRPKHFKKLAHVLHGVGSLATYYKHSLDYYDAVLLSGPFMEAEIRELEAKRGLKPKECVPAGLPYFDELNGEGRIETRPATKPTILIAPSWGAKNMLNVCGFDFIHQLARDENEIIIRPHPQSWKSELELLNKLKEEMKAYSNVGIDREVSAATSMARADVLISEKSGVRFDFAFIYKKPVISIDIPSENMTEYEWSDLSSVWDEKAQHKIGPVIKASEISQLSQALKLALQVDAKQIEQFRDESIYFVGNSADKIVDWLVRNANTESTQGEM